MAKWNIITCKRSDLQLLGTLNGGQSFRWKKKTAETEQWIGVFGAKTWILEQFDDCVRYQVYETANESEEPLSKIPKMTENNVNEQLLKDYFRLDLNLNKYYKEWSSADQYFKAAAQQFYGIRILKQEIVENIFSFICSSNNNISRISSMVDKLALFYGSKICTLDGNTYYSFPNVEALAGKDVENELRANGFGYRAKYISKSAQYIIQEGGEKWIEKLKGMDYKTAKTTLMQLTGVGAKVADCICLMSLGHLQAIPVDTHIFQIASRLYMPHLAKQKSVTDKIYNEIGDYFRELYGPLAGWAHTVLFCADLKKFQIEPKQETNNDKQRKKTT